MTSEQVLVAEIATPKLVAKLKVLETEKLAALVRWLRERGISWGEKVRAGTPIYQGDEGAGRQFEGHSARWLSEARVERLSAVAELMLLRDQEGS